MCHSTVTHAGESVVGVMGFIANLDARLSSGIESEMKGEENAAAERMAKVTFATQSAFSFGGTEKFCPTL